MASTTPSSPPTIRWGILATGLIAQSFTKDLLLSPLTRNVTTHTHTVVAAASSSSATRAADFLKIVGAPSSARPYGSYEELVRDPDIDIIYIATPHSHHFQNAMLCLEAGKNVLCEKAFTVNAKQAKILMETAREKNLFLMEAVWTRYFPVSIYVRDIITSNRLGPICRVQADFSFAQNPSVTYASGTHRMVNPALAGGALLDLGIYALTWCFQTLYTPQPASQRTKPSVVSSMKHFKTGTDLQTTMLLTFPRPEESGGDAHAVASCSMLFATDTDGKGSAGPSARIIGPKGEIQIFGTLARPGRSRLVLADGTVEDKEWKHPGPGVGSGWYNGFANTMNPEGEGHGMFWEADEAATALLEGRKEGRCEGLEESVVIMEIMDEVRRQGGLVFPENIESTEYPLVLDSKS